ncbi:Glucose-repressible alcohol dehydrogenase transcriptional effector, partial [Podochytrium sp. JEL0797]
MDSGPRAATPNTELAAAANLSVANDEGSTPGHISQSVPITSWDEYQYNLFTTAPAAKLSDSDDDLLRMVDWVVGVDSSEEEELGAKDRNRLSSASFSKGNFLFQSTSSSYKHQFGKQGSNPQQQQPASATTTNKLDNDDIFDLDLDLSPAPFATSFPNRPARSSLLAQAQFPSLAKPLSTTRSGPNSGEPTPTATFKTLRNSASNSSLKPIPGINLSSSHGNSPATHAAHSFQNRYGTSPSNFTAYSYGSSPQQIHAQQQQPPAGASPVLINSYIGSGNAMRPNGLVSTTPVIGGMLASSFDSHGSGFPQLSSSYQGNQAFRGPASVAGGGGAGASFGHFDANKLNAGLGVHLSGGGGGGGGSNGGFGGPGDGMSKGMLLPPGRVVGGLVLNSNGVAKSELAEDGCPILKVPRMPFLGLPGTMEIPHRVWKKGGTEKPDNRHFMIMSYNVLAPMYCTDSRYKHSKGEILEWEHRRKMILDEIAFYSPDFICLQELPPTDFKEVFLPTLQKIGYDGHFQQKKREHAADGCAIFFLEARFSLMAVQAFAYNDQIPQDPTTDLHQRIHAFPNIALVCVFQNRQARSLRCRIVNTHLHWDPEYADAKLLQAAILMEWLERAPHRDVPTAIAGDFNSRAGEAVVDFLVRGKVAPGPLFSGKDFGRFTKSLTVRNPLTGGTVLASTLVGVAGFEGLLDGGVVIQNPNAVVSSSLGGQTTQTQTLLPLLRHGTKLASAYDRKDLPFTNKTPDFEGSIDHILYTSGTLSIRDVLGDFDQSYYPSPPAEPTATTSSETDDPAETSTSPVTAAASVTPTPINPTLTAPTRPYHHHQPPPPQGYLAKIHSFPTPHIPSDHLPLCAWLKWKTVPVGTGPGVATTTGLSSSTTTSSTATGGTSQPNGTGMLGTSVTGGGRSRGGRRGMTQQLQVQQQQQHMFSTSAPGGTPQPRGSIPTNPATGSSGGGMSQVQMQLLMQHQHQQQQQQQQQQGMHFSAAVTGQKSALSMGLMNQQG